MGVDGGAVVNETATGLTNSNFSAAKDLTSIIGIDKKITTTMDGRVVTTDVKGEEEEDNDSDYEDGELDSA